MKLITVLTLAASVIPAAMAACCDLATTCADGTRGTPCCATGSCNIFCCACKGHCRTKNRRGVSDVFERSSETDEDSGVFAMADTRGAGNITLDEYLSFVGVDGRPAMYVDWFNRHDKDGNGVLTTDEIRLQEN